MDAAVNSQYLKLQTTPAGAEPGSSDVWTNGVFESAGRFLQMPGRVPRSSPPLTAARPSSPDVFFCVRISRRRVQTLRPVISSPGDLGGLSNQQRSSRLQINW